MSEAEFDMLLDAVRTAIAPTPVEDSRSATLPVFGAPRRAANDNQMPWPLIPFPKDWHASC